MPIRPTPIFVLCLAGCVFEPPWGGVPADPRAEPPTDPADPAEPPAGPDPEFGQDGLVLLDRSIGESEYARMIATRPAGGLALAVIGRAGDDVDSAVVWLSETGALEAVAPYRTPSDDYLEALAADETGAIYATGAVVHSGVEARIPILKYRAPGELDGEFGEAGRVLVPGLSPGCIEEQRIFEVAFGLKVRGPHVFITGNASEAGCVHRDMIVARLDRITGALDPGFGTGGLSSAPALEGDRTDNGQDILLLEDGHIAVVGNTNETSEFATAQAVLWLHAEDGSVEQVEVLNDIDGNGPGSESFRAAAAGRDGRLIAAGRSYNGTDTDMIVVCFEPSGAIDRAFGDEGVFVHGSTGDDRARRAAADGSGRIVVVGEVFNGTDADVAVWRLTPDGAPDETWGEDGIVQIDLGGEERGEGLAFDAEGRIFVAGSAEGKDGLSNAFIVRLEP